VNLSDLIPGVGEAKMIAAGVGLAAVLALAGYAVWQHREAVSLSQRLSEAQATVGKLERANASQETAIASLEKAVAGWRALVPTPEAAAAAADRMAAAAKALEDRARTLNGREASDNAKPDCAKLLAVDLAAVCPAHADSMRSRAAGLH